MTISKKMSAAPYRRFMEPMESECLHHRRQ